MKIGKLNQRIRVEQRSSSQNAEDGSPVATWSTVTTLWAEVQEVLPSKGEGQAQGFKIATRPARVRTRYVSGITAAMRIVLLSRGDRVMQILSPPVELGNQNGLEFMVADFSTSGNAQ